MIKITLQNKLLILQFNYDKSIIKIVKTIPSRKFNFKHKFWTINISHAEQTINALKGFEVDIDPAIQQEVASRKDTETALEKIKSQDDINIKSLNPLFDYQRVGVAFLLKAGNALLADQVGLGKTLMMIETCISRGDKKVLVICPKILFENWANEIKKWAPEYKTFIITGNSKQRAEIYERIKSCEIKYFAIINYELLRIDIDELEKI